MERKLKTLHGGFVLITVLIITAVGLLFGAGALLLFRYQCQRRIDRQHELERIYAVRSAVNYAKTAFITKSTTFGCQTSSGRSLELNVVPAKRIFPDPNNSAHLDIGNDCGKGRVFSQNGNEQYVSDLDYEYGVMSNGTVLTVTDQQISSRIVNGSGRLLFPDCTATNGVRWWVNIGLKDTRGWLQMDYGMRYSFSPQDYGPGNGDCLRLCIIRNTNHVEKVGREWIGCRRGWPLSIGERAFVLEVKYKEGGSGKMGEMTLYEYAYGRDPIPRLNLESPATANMGIQFAGRNAYLFYFDNVTSASGYVLSDAWEMPDEPNGIFDYFSKAMQSESAVTEQKGTIRAVIECEASSSNRPYFRKNDNNDVTAGEVSVSSFRVFPAYQYDVYLKCADQEPELATVAQKMGKYDPDLIQKVGKNGSYCLYFSMRTYDTHGTAWKGYKKGTGRQ